MKNITSTAILVAAFLCSSAIPAAVAFEPYPGSAGAAEQAEQADRRLWNERQAKKAQMPPASTPEECANTASLSELIATSAYGSVHNLRVARYLRTFPAGNNSNWCVAYLQLNDGTVHQAFWAFGIHDGRAHLIGFDGVPQ